MSRLDDVVAELERESDRLARAEKPRRVPTLHEAPAAAAVPRAVAAMPVAPPPSYREFLEKHNGWENAWDGFDIMGVEGKHTDRDREDIGVSVREEAWALSRLTKGVDPAAKYTADEEQKPTFVYLPNHLIFATDLNGRLGLFDRRTRRDDGEMEVLLWSHDSDIYHRFPGFVAFLEHALEDTRKRVAEAQRPAPVPAADPETLARRREMVELLGETIGEISERRAKAPKKRPARGKKKPPARGKRKPPAPGKKRPSARGKKTPPPRGKNKKGR